MRALTTNRGRPNGAKGSKVKRVCEGILGVLLRERKRLHVWEAPMSPPESLAWPRTEIIELFRNGHISKFGNPSYPSE